MKKRKPPEQPPADFKNNPFKSLKRAATSTALRAKQPIPPPVNKQIDSKDEDEATLFLRAAEGARKFVHDPDEHLARNAGQAPAKTRVQAPKDDQLFLAAMEKIGTTFHESFQAREQEETGQRSPTSRMRQLKRGTIRISQELDLHGFLKEEALARLKEFVAEAHSQGQQAVLVITGKGINSPEGPVLHGAVSEWLRHKEKGLIAEFSSAPRELGGSGAFVVFLKKG